MEKPTKVYRRLALLALLGFELLSVSSLTHAKLIPTPVGYLPEECVHEVEEGAHLIELDDGSHLVKVRSLRFPIIYTITRIYLYVDSPSCVYYA